MGPYAPLWTIVSALTLKLGIKGIFLYEETIYKKEDVVLLPMRQLSTKDQNDTDINNYRSPYGLQQ